MNILITGATGFIGQALTAHLKQKHVVMPMSSRSRKPHQGLVCDLGSLRSTQATAAALKGKKVDAIIHLASVVCTPQNRTQVKLLDNNNAISSNFVALAQALDPRLLLHASSMAVYPNQDGVYKENGIIDPSGNGDGLYGLAKFNAEMFLNFFLSPQMKLMHLRLTQVYGPGMRQDRIFTSMVKELRQKNTITVFGNGERVTNFIHIRDVIATIDGMLNGPRSGIYNVGAFKHMTLEQWAKKIIRQYGNARSRVIKFDKGSRVKQRIDTRLLNKIFGLKNQTVDLSGIDA